jgi:Zn-dependent peptidase ImmA (M78 family)
MRTQRLPPEEEAVRILQEARREYAGLGETWSWYPIDVELIGSLLFDLAVQRVADLKVGSKAYAAVLTAPAQLIAVEAHDHEHRQRFSVAHEIGHFTLHFMKDPRLKLFACSDADMQVQAVSPGLHAKREWEANLFAAELLMPAEQVQVMFRVVKGSLFKLSRHFKVSPQAMEIRLKSLELAAVS